MIVNRFEEINETLRKFGFLGIWPEGEWHLRDINGIPRGCGTLVNTPPELGGLMLIIR